MKLNIKLTLVTMILVTLLMGVFGGIVLYNLEQTHVRESISYMQSTMERRMDSIDNPQSPIPNPQSPFLIIKYIK